MIEPTIGRVVLVRPKNTMEEQAVRNDCQVAFVHSNTMVNLGCLNENGVHYSEQLVRLVHGDEPCQPGCCEWMEYQKGQAQEKPPEWLDPSALSDEAVNERIEALENLVAGVVNEEEADSDSDIGPDGTDESTDDITEETNVSGDEEETIQPVLKISTEKAEEKDAEVGGKAGNSN